MDKSQDCGMSLYIECLDNSQLDFTACSYTEALLLLVVGHQTEKVVILAARQ